jgi:hypothetical protein
MRDGVREPPGRHQRETDVEMAIGVLLVQGDRLADELDRLLVAARLVGDETQQVDARRVVRRGSQDGAAQALGLGELARLHASDGRSEPRVRHVICSSAQCHARSAGITYFANNSTECRHSTGRRSPNANCPTT